MIDPRDRKELRHALSRIPFFANVLDDRQIDALAADSRLVRFGAGTILMAQGDFGSTMFGIVEGSVTVTYMDRHERERSVATLSAGDVVGEMALLTGERRSATATAIVGVTAVEITRTALERLIAAAPEIVENFGTTLAERHAVLEDIERENRGAVVQRFITEIRDVFHSLFGEEPGRS